MGANNIALGVVIGGAVGATFGKALSDSSAKLDAFKQKAERMRGEQVRIGAAVELRGLNLRKYGEIRRETLTLEKQWKDSTARVSELSKKLADARRQAASGGSAEAGAAEARLAAEFKKAEAAAVGAKRAFAAKRAEADRLQAGLRGTRDEAKSAAAQMDRLGKVVRGLELGAAGRVRIGEAVEAGRKAWRVGAAVTAATTVPTLVSAKYQAVVRDIAIKGGFPRTAQEADMSERIRGSAARNGISRDDLAGAINQLVSGGMEAREALSYADLIGKFTIGQGASAEETGQMIRALSQNAKITDPAAMTRALEAVAYLGKAGNFESPDMAKAFPGLLAEMEKLGIFGQDAVSQLGAMLQVQMKVTGSADEAANNLRNWFAKIKTGETKANYAKQGIDYEKAMNANIAKGWSPLEASLGLAKRYVESIDPKKARELEKFASSMDKVSDPQKRQAQIRAFEDAMKTGDLFNDMQVNAALTAYMQNSALYRKLKHESANASGNLDKDLTDRRAASQNKWGEVGNAANESFARIGDAIRPATDALADGLKTVAESISGVATRCPGLTSGFVGLGAALAASLTVFAAWKAVSGAVAIARGAMMARDVLGPLGKGKGGKLGKITDIIGAATGAGAQQVFVTNWPSGGGGGFDLPDRGGRQPGKGRASGRISKSSRLARVGRAAGGVAEASPAAARAGTLARVGTALGGVVAAARLGLAAPSLGAIASGGAGTVATSAGLVAGAGAAGYALGSVINMGINKALSAQAGHDYSLGSWIYDKVHAGKPAPVIGGALRQTPGVGSALLAKQPFAAMPSPVITRLAPRAPLLSDTALAWPRPIPALAMRLPTLPPSPVSVAVKQAAQTPVAVAPAPAKDRAPAAQLTFAPVISLKVAGDVKDPRQIARDLMPHLRRLFDEFQAAQSRRALYDGAHV